MIPYGLLASIVLFAIVARHADRFHVLLSAAFVVIGMLILDLFTYSIIYGFESAIAEFTSIRQFVKIGIQYGIAIFVFRGIVRNTNDAPGYLLWVAAGWPLIFVLVPFLVARIP